MSEVKREFVGPKAGCPRLVPDASSVAPFIKTIEAGTVVMDRQGNTIFSTKEGIRRRVSALSAKEMADRGRAIIDLVANCTACSSDAAAGDCPLTRSDIVQVLARIRS
ncbi:hypothetical protein HYW35_01180 [Candidatus Saccharibacteria bacterium]|nr:hypothetical protein [Candidatus Saccharibacteria bacterium]